MLSEDCCGIFLLRHHTSCFLFLLQITQLDHLPLPSAFKDGSFWYFEVIVLFSAEHSFHKSWGRRGLSARSMKTAGRCAKHLWLCDCGGQMLFSHTATLSATADHPLDNFLFLSVSEGPQILSGGKDAMPDYNKRSGLWCRYGEICYTLSQC